MSAQNALAQAQAAQLKAQQDQQKQQTTLQQQQQEDEEAFARGLRGQRSLLSSAGELGFRTTVGG